MPPEINVVIPGDPVAQGRPRVRTIDGKPRLYSPKVSRKWREAAAKEMLTAYRGEPLTGPLVVSILVMFRLPKSMHRKRHPVRNSVPHSVRPDFDNVAKAVCDAAKGILFRDDAQIYDARVRKFYCPQGVDPYVLVCVMEAP